MQEGLLAGRGHSSNKLLHRNHKNGRVVNESMFFGSQLSPENGIPRSGMAAPVWQDHCGSVPDVAFVERYVRLLTETAKLSLKRHAAVVFYLIGDVCLE